MLKIGFQLTAHQFRNQSTDNKQEVKYKSLFVQKYLGSPGVSNPKFPTLNTKSGTLATELLLA